MRRGVGAHRPPMPSWPGTVPSGTMRSVHHRRSRLNNEDLLKISPFPSDSLCDGNLRSACSLSGLWLLWFAGQPGARLGACSLHDRLPHLRPVVDRLDLPDLVVCLADLRHGLLWYVRSLRVRPACAHERRPLSRMRPGAPARTEFLNLMERGIPSGCSALIPQNRLRHRISPYYARTSRALTGHPHDSARM